MSRLLATIVILLVVVVGGLFLLAGRARERPTTHVEKVVSLGNLT
jgi:hypothetical protein